MRKSESKHSHPYPCARKGFSQTLRDARPHLSNYAQGQTKTQNKKAQNLAYPTATCQLMCKHQSARRDIPRRNPPSQFTPGFVPAPLSPSSSSSVKRTESESVGPARDSAAISYGNGVNSGSAAKYIALDYIRAWVRPCPRRATFARGRRLRPYKEGSERAKPRRYATGCLFSRCPFMGLCVTTGAAAVQALCNALCCWSSYTTNEV